MFLIYNSIEPPGKSNYQDDIILTKAQNKQWKKGIRPTAIEYWPRNDEDGLFYIPFTITKGFTLEEIGYIKAAFIEFAKHTNIR